MSPQVEDKHKTREKTRPSAVNVNTFHIDFLMRFKEEAAGF